MNKQEGNKVGRLEGWLAVSPLLVFLAVYLVSSLIAGDFYKTPVSMAFLIASIYAVAIFRGERLDRRIEIFSTGAADSNVLMMIWIFVLAGAFAGSAKAIGSIDATVNMALAVLPGKMIFAGLFLASCFISMAIGTSVGTITALVPLAAGMAQSTGAGVPMMTAIVVGGAFFGDNLSFISDTTIAATRTQGCSMSDKFKTNIWIAAPAAVLALIIYLALGWSADITPKVEAFDWMLVLPYILIIVLALCRMNVTLVLVIGIIANAALGFRTDGWGWMEFLSAAGNGIMGMSELIIVTLLASGMLAVIRSMRGLDFIMQGLTRHISGKRGAELSIAALVGLSNFCTANNTIAIITAGGIASDITKKYGLDPRKTASILDTFSCLVQSLIPYGAQLLMASALATEALSGISEAAVAEPVSSVSIISGLYYPFALGLMAILSILLRFPRKYSGK